MSKKQSRSDRWMNAVSAAKDAVSDLNEAAENLDYSGVEIAVGDLQDAMEDLANVKQEYQEWYENMPEGLQASATGEKLEEVTNLDVENAGVDTSEVQDAIRQAVEDLLADVTDLLDEAENVELPVGFGRD